MVNLCTPPSVLDIGCGQGLLGTLLHTKRPGQFSRIVGVDNDPRIIADGLMRYAQAGLGMPLICGEAEQFDFADNMFSTIVLGEILEHVADTAPVISEALRVLEPSGRLIASVPAELTLSRAHERIFENVEELMKLFGDDVVWCEMRTLHRWYFAWGDRNGSGSVEE